jgi:hypothetical protein
MAGIAGRFAFTIFALGIIGAGLLAVPVFNAQGARERFTARSR